MVCYIFLLREHEEKMTRSRKVSRHTGTQLPLFVEKDEDGFYVVECPLFEGCYTQGKTLDQALKNIREVIQLILEEKDSRKILHSYRPREISLHTITV
jgi:predicted RNase H-like HicB family nuclease